MKLKLDSDGHVVVQDGKPVYLDSDGKEIAFDAPSTIATISRLNGEAKNHRERAEAAEEIVKKFEGITDPELARKALTTVKNLDDKKLVDAGQIEQIKQEAIKAIEDKYKPVVEERDKLKADFHQEMKGGNFARSKFIQEKLVDSMTSDLVEARFGGNFKVEDRKLIAYDQTGNKIFSRSKPGELAEFDEALSILVDQHPHRDKFLKGSSASGGGTQSQSNTTTGGKRTITRAQFDALDPMARIAAAKDATITD